MGLCVLVSLWGCLYMCVSLMMRELVLRFYTHLVTYQLALSFTQGSNICFYLTGFSSAFLQNKVFKLQMDEGSFAASKVK